MEDANHGPWKCHGIKSTITNGKAQEKFVSCAATPLKPSQCSGILVFPLCQKTIHSLNDRLVFEGMVKSNVKIIVFWCMCVFFHSLTHVTFKFHQALRPGVFRPEKCGEIGSSACFLFWTYEHCKLLLYEDTHILCNAYFQHCSDLNHQAQRVY